MKIKKGTEEKFNYFKEINSKDAIGIAVLNYATRWADLMEKHKGTLDGKTIEELSHEADKEGISGAMYSIAVSVLTKFWENGEKFRKTLDEYKKAERNKILGR